MIFIILMPVKRIFLVSSLSLLLVSCGHQSLEQVLFTSQQPQPQLGKVSCYRIPALATAPNGNVIAACDQRVRSCTDLGGNEDINIVIRTSRNHGKTWSDIRCISMTVLSGGDIGVLYERNDYKEIVFTRLRKSEYLQTRKDE